MTSSSSELESSELELTSSCGDLFNRKEEVSDE